jgi:pyruvate dehydrogenase E1 component beta subunit
MKQSYGKAILEAHEYLLTNHPEVFIFGQGLWSPWYVGSTMTDLDKKFGKERIIDSPVSEVAVTGAGLGASLYGYKPIIVHPRMDFMILAVDQIVTQAAKWSSMFGGKSNPNLTVRGIVNRGGEQGAQHSQSLHSWFSHIPGLRVVMPSSVRDARDLLIASVLSPDPVLFIEDRWLYDIEEDVPEIEILNLKDVPTCITRTEGNKLTVVSNSYCSSIALNVIERLNASGKSIEFIDVRILNPMQYDVIENSVNKTGALLVIDGGWTNSGFAGEIIAGVMERVDPKNIRIKPFRLNTVDAPAPTSKVLEKEYYVTEEKIEDTINQMLK